MPDWNNRSRLDIVFLRRCGPPIPLLSREPSVRVLCPSTLPSTAAADLVFCQSLELGSSSVDESEKFRSDETIEIDVSLWDLEDGGHQEAKLGGRRSIAVRHLVLGAERQDELDMLGTPDDVRIRGAGQTEIGKYLEQSLEQDDHVCCVYQGWLCLRLFDYPSLCRPYYSLGLLS